MNWDNITKSWKSTLVGILMLIAAGYKFYQTGEVNWSELVVGLTGVGFILTKDFNGTHTKE